MSEDRRHRAADRRRLRRRQGLPQAPIRGDAVDIGRDVLTREPPVTVPHQPLVAVRVLVPDPRDDRQPQRPGITRSTPADRPTRHECFSLVHSAMRAASSGGHPGNCARNAAAPV